MKYQYVGRYVLQCQIWLQNLVQKTWILDTFFSWFCKQIWHWSIYLHFVRPFPRWEGKKNSCHQINLPDYHLLIWQNLYLYIFTFRYCKNKSLRLSDIVSLKNKNAKYTQRLNNNNKFYMTSYICKISICR